MQSRPLEAAEGRGRSQAIGERGADMVTRVLRVLIPAIFVAATFGAAWAVPAGAKVSGPNRQIVFGRFEKSLDDTVVYLVNPDVSGLERLSPGRLKFGEEPHWSPDGSKVVFISPPPSDLPGSPDVFAVIANVDAGTFQPTPILQPAILFTDCHIWSPD